MNFGNYNVSDCATSSELCNRTCLTLTKCAPEAQNPFDPTSLLTILREAVMDVIGASTEVPVIIDWIQSDLQGIVDLVDTFKGSVTDFEGKISQIQESMNTLFDSVDRLKKQEIVDL